MASAAFQKALKSLCDVHEQELAHLRAELLRARGGNDDTQASQSFLDDSPCSLRQCADDHDHPQIDAQLEELSPASAGSCGSSGKSRPSAKLLELQDMPADSGLCRDAQSANSSSAISGHGLGTAAEDVKRQSLTEPPGSLAMVRRTVSENGSHKMQKGKLRRSNDEDLEVFELMSLNPIWREIALMTASFAFGAGPADNDREQVMARMSFHRSKSCLMEGSPETGYKGLRKNQTMSRSKSQFFNKSRRVTKFYERSGDDFANCSMDTFVSSPISRRRLVWDFTGLIFLFYDLVMVPLQVFEPKETLFIAAMNLITCGFWTGDLIASFFVGYHTNGHVEMRPRMIAKHYMKSWFALDITLVISDWCFLSMGFGTNARFMRLGKVAKCARVLRLCRIMKFHMLVVDMADHIHSEYKRTLLGIAKLLLFIVAINHFIACVWYGLHHLREGETWVKSNFEVHDELGMRYWTSMHWSMTQFTPASMEVVPVNSLERFYTVCVLTFALVTFSSFVSSITQSMTHLRNINARELEQQSNLHRYLAEHTISSQLVNRILHFIRDRRQYARKPTRMKETDVALFHELPESVKMELRTEVHVPIITVHPLFYNYNLADPAAIRHICKNAIQEKTLIQREELFADSSVANQAVFMSEGCLIYTYPTRDFNEAKAYIGKSEWVCEAYLWASNADLFGPLVAEMSSEMLLLNSQEFISIVKRYEGSAKQIARYAELFVREVNKGLAECRWASILCNNFDSIRDLAQLAFEGPTEPAAEGEEKEKFSSEEAAPPSKGNRRGSLFGSNAGALDPTLLPGGMIRSITDFISKKSTTDGPQGRPVVHAVDIERHSQVDDFPGSLPLEAATDAYEHAADAERQSYLNSDAKAPQSSDERTSREFARANSAHSLS